LPTDDACLALEVVSKSCATLLSQRPGSLLLAECV